MRLHGFNSLTLGVLVLSVITLSGCEDLAVRDMASLLVPRFQRSEILGFVAGFGTTFAAVPDLVTMVQCRDQSEDGGHHGRLSNGLGLLRVVDSVATGDCLEHGRGRDQFPERRRVSVFRPQRKAASQRVNAVCPPACPARDMAVSMRVAQAYGWPDAMQARTPAPPYAHDQRRLWAVS